MAERYPKRPPYFSHRFTRLLFKTCVANELGAEGVLMLIAVAHTEDAKNYRGPVTFWNGQLMPLIGCNSEKTFRRVRDVAVDAGWLRFVPGTRATAPKYWVLIPEQYAGLDDLPSDESPHDYIDTTPFNVVNNDQESGIDRASIGHRSGIDRASIGNSKGGTSTLPLSLPLSQEQIPSAAAAAGGAGPPAGIAPSSPAGLDAGSTGTSAGGSQVSPAGRSADDPASASVGDDRASAGQKRAKKRTALQPAQPDPRPRDLLFDAVAEVTASDPKVSGSHVGKVRRLLARADPAYTPDEVREFGRRFWEFCPWAERDGRTTPTLGEIEKNIGKVRAAGPPTLFAPPRGKPTRQDGVMTEILGALEVVSGRDGQARAALAPVPPGGAGGTG